MPISRNCLGKQMSRALNVYDSRRQAVKSVLVEFIVNWITGWKVGSCSDNCWNKLPSSRALCFWGFPWQFLWWFIMQNNVTVSPWAFSDGEVYWVSVQFSHSVVSDSFRPHESQHARPSCPSPTSGVYSNLCPSSRWCHPASSSVVPFSSCPPNPSQPQGLFQWVNSSHEVAKVLEFQLQHQSFQWTNQD